MIYHYSFIKNSLLPEQYKQALLKAMHYIEDECPVPLTTVLLFGGVARNEIKYNSDIDICMVFPDDTNLRDDKFRIFRWSINDGVSPVYIDTTVLLKSRLESNSKLLHREINRDKIVLAE